MSEHRAPRASILVCNLEAGAHLDRCIGSLARHVEAPVELIVVANGRRADRSAAERLHPHGRTIRARCNLGFAGGLQLARRHARAPVLVILQDDVELRDDALAPLLGALEHDAQFGMVGSRAVLPSGELQAAGARIVSYRDAAGAAHPLPELLGEAALDARGGPAEVDLLTSGFVAVQAEAWDACGGPDASLFPAGFVDYDLSMAVRAAGWRVGVEPRSTVVHERGHSLRGPTRDVVLQRNYKTWRERWREHIGERPRTGVSDLARSLLDAPAPTRPGASDSSWVLYGVVLRAALARRTRRS